MQRQTVIGHYCRRAYGIGNALRFPGQWPLFGEFDYESACEVGAAGWTDPKNDYV